MENTAYDSREEYWNVLTHGFGLFLSLIATVLLVQQGNTLSIWHLVSFSVYGFSLVILYAASTLYHNAKKPKIRRRLNIFDHASIYILIAGTYTPYLLVTLRGAWGWSLFGVIWGMALIGVILKLFYTGKYDKISTIAYVIMGWMAVIASYPLYQNLPVNGLLFLLAGGLFYSVGAVFYLKEKIHFNHVIFHVFVLLGSISHFVSVYYYVR
jgi:hemolysin III